MRAHRGEAKRRKLAHQRASSGVYVLTRYGGAVELIVGTLDGVKGYIERDARHGFDWRVYAGPVSTRRAREIEQFLLNCTHSTFLG